MKTTVFFGLLLLGLAATAPADEDGDIMTVKTSQNTTRLVNIFIPFNALNTFEIIDDHDEDIGTSKDDRIITLFYIETHVHDNGHVEEKGLYVFRAGKAKKLLDHGRDATVFNVESKLVYFAAKDGIYVYNNEKETAEKYGSVTDNLIAIAKENGTDALYVLTEDKQLYKVTDDGNKKVKIDYVENAEQIVIDSSNNYYFLKSDKTPSIINNGKVKIIENLPDKSKITVLRPQFLFQEALRVVLKVDLSS